MGRLMNSYFYGKAGKGDFKKSDLPTNRWQLFWEMLRIRISALIRMNLMTVIAFLPTIVVLVYNISNILMVSNTLNEYRLTGQVSSYNSETQETVYVEASDELKALAAEEETSGSAWMMSALAHMCVLLIPCILITGPVQAGMAYVTRNWARDEHAFIWSDFKDAVKGNWKQGLGVSAISSVLPLIVVECWQFYGNLAATRSFLLFTVLQMVIVVLAAIWFLSLAISYPMMVGYQVTFRQLIKNSVILALARLPQTLGIRLATLIPAGIFVAAMLLFNLNWMTGMLLICAWYFLLGNSLTRFVHAAYTNGLFEKYLNPRIPGARTNIGLADKSDEEDEDDESETGEGVSDPE